MGQRSEVMRRQSTRTRFHNSDMDFALNWALGVSQIIGMSPGEVLAAVATVKDGDPGSWCDSFSREGEYLSRRSESAEREENRLAAGHDAFAAAYARRFALGLQDPADPAWVSTVARMELDFARGAALAGIPLRPVEIPFEHGTLPAYHIGIEGSGRPTVLVIGGGDTFREDLFYFGGYPAWQRGYNALMVDLPGQGNTPAAGLTFRHDASASIGACLDWLESRAYTSDHRIAIYGLSGGGYFTAQAVAVDPRITAWIASTPITDMALVFERGLGAAAKAPGWALNAASRVLGRTNAVLAISLKKYAWQFGTSDFAESVRRVKNEAPIVQAEEIAVPSLFLVASGEAAELRRQTDELTAAMRRGGHAVTVRLFEHEEGDAHCQVTNLRLAHQVVFDWLDQVLGTGATPPA